ncbi:transcription factor-like 5 protein [Protopterus annectens]|uniref:transcription factor-like 5 protein n=1 Tax=Protopterus annectens TaxID=7888 RepID=UPI001CF9F9E5|nr:transcription factor-like 5 protein [Protopterus annectens]
MFAAGMSVPPQVQLLTPPRTVVSEQGPAPAGDAQTEQGLSYTSTDLNLVEMSEVEYTQLQHILYSQMETQTAEGEIETRLNPALFSNSTNPIYQSSGGQSQVSYSLPSTANPLMHPAMGQPSSNSDSHYLTSNQCMGHIDVQELKLMLFSDPSVNKIAQVEKTPNSVFGNASGLSITRLKNTETMSYTNKENIPVEKSGMAAECKPKSTVRVRLEDRFNSISSDIPRCQENQESGVTLSNLVTLIRHPSELIGMPSHQQQNKCTALVKNKAAATSALQFAYPLFAANICSSAESCSSTQSQDTGSLCHMLESTKHKELGLPRALSYCYQQESESAKPSMSSRSKVLPEQIWIKVEDALCMQAANRSSRGRIRRVNTSADRRALNDIQNVPESQNTASTQEEQWPSTRSKPTDLSPNKQAPGTSQRRERHNRMERDRRRRIRNCCDELNLLVPFCTSETDKATTLQWTASFLKYIQERHGDTLKKEFESVFCGKTGRQLKMARADFVEACPVRENLQTISEADNK